MKNQNVKQLLRITLIATAAYAILLYTFDYISSTPFYFDPSILLFAVFTSLIGLTIAGIIDFLASLKRPTNVRRIHTITHIALFLCLLTLDIEILLPSDKQTIYRAMQDPINENNREVKFVPATSADDTAALRTAAEFMLEEQQRLLRK